MALLLEALQNNRNYDAWVAARVGKGQQQPEKDEEDEGDEGDQEDEKLDQPKRVPVFNAAKTVANTYDPSQRYFSDHIHQMFDQMRKGQINTKAIEQIIDHFKVLGDPDPKGENYIELFMTFMGEDEKTVRAKYQAFSIPEAVSMVYEKFGAEVDFDFAVLKPHLIEQYTAEPLT